MGFLRAEMAEPLRAVGSLEGLPPQVRRALSSNGDFDPIPQPGPHDWLRIARERGQSFEEFARTASNRPAEARQRIYLRPVGEFSADDSPLLQQLQQFGSRFFAREVQLIPPLGVERTGITMRRNRFTDVVQLKTRDILPLLARDLPPDGWCVLGVTRYDLYPHDTWSFVFGEALLDDRVAVFSVARYDPAFYGQREDPSLLFRRSCRVLAHEGCHMFGMRHCVFFNCLMNGSNHLAESDRRPLHLCPVDLRKVHWTLGFDIAERYRRLLAFWRGAGVDDEAEWIRRRLEFIEGR
jgi:archaemetzincin